MKAAKEADDLEDMKAKKEALEKVSQELAVKLYQQAQPEGGNDGAAQDGQSGNDDTVDGDFEDVSDDDKK